MDNKTLAFFKVFTICFLLTYSSTAQTGPGGIGSNDGTSDLSLWLDATQITGLTDGAELPGWLDLSGNGNHARIPANAPSYTNIGSNGRPTVTFDNANSEYLFVPTNIEVMPTNEVSVFVVGNYENASDNWGALISSSDDDNWDDGWGIAENNGTGNIMFYLDDYATNVCNHSASVDYGTDHVWSLIFNTTDNLGFGYKSESACSFAFNGPLNYNGGANDDLLIGAGPDNGGAGYFMNGDVSEVILYDVALNDAQRIIVTNYLAAKYGVALSANDVYNEDDNGNYDFDVAGIGRVDASNLHNDSQGTGIIRVLNPSGLGDDEFLMWGHDNGALQGSETTDVPVGVDARLDRVWRVSEVNTAGAAINVGAIDMRFDLSSFTSVTAGDLILLIDTDNDGVFTDETGITGATDLGGNIYEFSSVPGGAAGIRNNRRFTLGTTNSNRTTLYENEFTSNGPGGVGSTDGSSNLSLWLDASEISGVSDGADISEWIDLSGKGNHAQISTNAPSYSATAGGNSLPTITFDNANSEGLVVASTSNVMPAEEVSVFIVGNYEGTSDNWGAMISASDDDNWDDGWGIAQNNGTGNMMFYADDYTANVCTHSASADFGTNHIWSLVFNTTDNLVYGYKSEAGCSDTFNGPLNYNGGANDDLLIGSGPDNAGPAYFLNGDIAEILIYDVALNDAERIIVTNYLAAKYNISLSANDVYNEDDNGDYDHDVAGIGRTDAANTHASSRGTGILLIENPSDLGNNEFLVWGHDNGSLQGTEITDVPPGVDARLDRVWRASEVSTAGAAVDVGAVDMTFYLGNEGFENIDATDLVLLVDTDNDGVFNDESGITGATALGGNSFQYAGVTAITNNTRFTLGTMDASSTPLPVELVFFEAHLNVSGIVELTWQTASERNNDYFTVERSGDGYSWEMITRISGDGDSMEPRSYTSHDQRPLKGISYYRLSQTDFDGTTEVFDMVSVQNDLVHDKITISPNPASTMLNVKGASGKSPVILNLHGVDLTDKVTFSESGSVVKIDVSGLKKGIYLIRIGEHIERFVLK